MDVRAEIDRLAERVGRERYDGACAAAFEIGSSTDWPDDLDMVPHELSDFYYETSLSTADQTRVGMAIYREMPGYGHLMYLNSVVLDLAGDARDWFWGEVRSLLEAPDDRLAGPIGYWLWVDWFEVGDEDAWREVTRFDGDWQRRIARVLEVSGPAKWKWKAGLYARFAEEGREWQLPVLRGLVGSEFDLYGDIERERAREILALLDVPPDARGLKELRERLGRPGRS
jgi:hypothetical protein